MKKNIILLIIILLYGCSRFGKEKITFTEKLFLHPKHFYDLINESDYNCSGNEIYRDTLIQNFVNKNEYKFSTSDFGYVGIDSFDGKKYHTIRTDTIYYVVYESKHKTNEIVDHITFLFKMQNNKWCFDTITTMNGLEPTKSVPID